jgi:hypothetical protein
MSELDGTMVCCFDLKKSRKSFRTWLLERICDDVIMAIKSTVAALCERRTSPATAVIDRRRTPQSGVPAEKTDAELSESRLAKASSSFEQGGEQSQCLKMRDPTAAHGS